MAIAPGIVLSYGGGGGCDCPDIMTLLEESMSLAAELGVKLDVEHSITGKSVTFTCRPDEAIN